MTNSLAHPAYHLAWLATLLLCHMPGVSEAQGSHRLLEPPTSSETGLPASAALLQQLQQAVEQSGSDSQLPIDPSLVDPKLIEALRNLAEQMGPDQPLSPQLKQWLRQMQQLPAPSVPGNSENPLPNQQPPRPTDFPRQDSPSDRPGSHKPPPRSSSRSNSSRNNAFPGEPPHFKADRNGSPRSNRSSSRQSPKRLGTPDDRPASSQQPGQRSPGRNAVRPADLPEIPSPGKGPDGKQATHARNPKLEQLRDSGLTIQQQFDRVVEQARRQALLNGKSKPAEGGNRGLIAMLEKTVASSSEELVGAIDRARKGKRRRRSGRSDNRSPKELKLKLDESERSSLSKRFESFTQRANQMSQSITPSPAPADSSAPGRPDLSLPSASTGFSILTLVLALIGVGGVAYVLYYWQRKQAVSRHQQAAAMVPRQLTTRADVIRAFHALTNMTLTGEHGWWTHRRAGHALAAAAPQVRPAVEALMQVYEQARYLPAGEPLDSEQLRVANQALSVAWHKQSSTKQCGEQ